MADFVDRKFVETANPLIVDKILAMFNNHTIELPRTVAKYAEDTPEDVYEYSYKALLKYRKRIHDSHVIVKYSWTIPYFGRVNVRGMYSSMGNLCREIRGTIAADAGLIDIDVCNAHPTILAQLCDRFNIKYKYLKKYVNDRDQCIAHVMKHYKVNRDQAKQLFIRLIYGGSYTAWYRDLCLRPIMDHCHVGKEVAITLYDKLITGSEAWFKPLRDNSKPTKFIEGYQLELKRVFTAVIDRFPNVVSKVKEYHAKQKQAKPNWAGSYMSWILQDFERCILDTMMRYINHNVCSMTNCVLEYDGFMMPARYFKDSLLTELEEEILRVNGFKLRLATKPFETLVLK